VEKLDIPIAAIISIHNYERLAQEQHRRLGRKLEAIAKVEGLTEEQLIADIEEDRRAMHEEMYGSLQKDELSAEFKHLTT